MIPQVPGEAVGRVEAPRRRRVRHDVQHEEARQPARQEARGLGRPLLRKQGELFDLDTSNGNSVATYNIWY